MELVEIFLNKNSKYLIWKLKDCHHSVLRIQQKQLSTRRVDYGIYQKHKQFNPSYVYSKVNITEFNNRISSQDYMLA